MPRRPVALLLAAALACPAPLLAQDQDEKAQVPAADEAVTITSNGAHSVLVPGSETPDQCAAFRLTPGQVRDYFARAEAIDEAAYRDAAVKSPCYAAGTADLADGIGGNWMIDRAGRGNIIAADGTQRYYACADCFTAAPLDPPASDEG